MKNEKEGLRFDLLEIENFKGIDKRIVEINGKSFLITGKNNIGKSTLIQALLSGIDPKMQPTETIKNGETKASVKVKLSGILNGKEEEYTLETYYTPKNQKGRLVLLNSKQETVSSPKEVLKSLVGNISFDIFKFLNDTKPNKIKILKELSGVRVDIDKLDMERKKIFDERTYLNRSTTEMEATMNNHGMTPEDIEKYSETIPIEPIQEEMDNISKKITDWNGVKNKTQEFKNEFENLIPSESERLQSEIKEKEKRIRELHDAIEVLNNGISSLKERATTATEQYNKGQAWLAKNPEPNAKEISTRLSDALLHNENCAKVEALAERQKDLLKSKQKLQKMNSDIEGIDEKKDSLMKKSKLPVKGLKFTEDEIFLNGLPFEEGQINTAQLIDVGVEISMALNPNLKVIFLHEGSLFDKEALNVLIKKVEERGYQLIAEVVSENPDLSITFTEEEA